MVVMSGEGLDEQKPCMNGKTHMSQAQAGLHTRARQAKEALANPDGQSYITHCSSKPFLSCKCCFIALTSLDSSTGVLASSSSIASCWQRSMEN